MSACLCLDVKELVVHIRFLELNFDLIEIGKGVLDIKGMIGRRRFRRCLFQGWFFSPLLRTIGRSRQS